jgi:hypothetical protein
MENAMTPVSYELRIAHLNQLAKGGEIIAKESQGNFSNILAGLLFVGLIIVVIHYENRIQKLEAQSKLK